MRDRELILPSPIYSESVSSSDKVEGEGKVENPIDLVGLKELQTLSRNQVDAIVNQARIEERKRVLQVVDDYYNLYACEFCNKYKIKEKNPDMWDANKIIREALERGEEVK